jgi:hypothetical protein
VTRSVLSLRIDDKLRELLVVYAANHAITNTEVLTRAIKSFLDVEDGWSEPELPFDTGLSPEQKQAAREAFSAGRGCVFCGALHLRYCPRVKEVTFKAPGEPHSVRYWREGQFTWPEEIIWPDEVQEEPDA